jgi:adenine deaminase
VHLKKEVISQDFRIKVPDMRTVTANVIGIIENQAPTKHIKLEVPVKNGEVQVDLVNDLAKVAIIERHKGTGEIQLGLVNGFGLNVPCAIGSTVAHDSHQMIVVGTNEADMALAANTLVDINGGQVVVKNGEVIAMVELPIGGLMSNQRAEVVAEKAAKVLAGFKECGCSLNNPNMQLSLLALVVIPELRISNLGIVDVKTFEFIPLIES